MVAAIELLRQAAAAFEEPAATDPTHDLCWERLVNCHNDLGAIFFKLGRHPEAGAALQKALEIYQRLAAANPESLALR